jgi:hypothetical protein
VCASEGGQCFCPGGMVRYGAGLYGPGAEGFPIGTPVPWGTRLPLYNSLGGPQGRGHVTFDRTKNQYLDAGSRTLNIATNGGLTMVALHGNSWSV